MDTQNQFAVFGLCLFIGFLGGILYEPFSFFRFLCGCDRGKNKVLGGIFDIAFWIVFAVISVAAAYLFHFPALRVYMWIGEGVGLIIYLKTLHKILAFLQIMCYNKVTKRLKRREKHDKTLLKREKKTL